MNDVSFKMADWLPFLPGNSTFWSISPKLL